jgi:hypothetical protein
VGTLVVVWLCHILQERDHRLVSVRQWVAERTQTLASLLGTPLRDTDFTDDRLANVLMMLAGVRGGAFSAYPSPLASATQDREVVRVAA